MVTKKQREFYIDEIRNFIGRNGVISFEHGYTYPYINKKNKFHSIGVGNDNIIYIIVLDEKNKGKIMFERDLFNVQMKTIYNELFKYHRYVCNGYRI